MMPAQTTSRKPAAYTPCISFKDHTTGIFLVQSNSCDLVSYQVNVLTRTCECLCGQHGFRNSKQGTCRHIRAALAVYLSLEEYRLRQLAAQPPTPSTAPAFVPVPTEMAWA